MRGRTPISPGRPRVSWHRGGGEIAPFATLPAFSSAAAHRAELIEVDLRETADGALVCVHDPVVPGVGRIGDLNWAELGESLQKSGAVIDFGAWLDELDAEDPERFCRVHLDLKEVGHEARAVGAIVARGRPVTVTSGQAAAVRAVREAWPDVPALLTIGSDGRGLRLAELIRLRAGEILPFRQIDRCGATGVAAYHLLATPLLRRWCRWRGLELLIWTVDDDQALRRWLARSDVDVVTTNRPLAALAIRDGMAP